MDINANQSNNRSKLADCCLTCALSVWYVIKCIFCCWIIELCLHRRESVRSTMDSENRTADIGLGERQVQYYEPAIPDVIPETSSIPEPSPEEIEYYAAMNQAFTEYSNLLQKTENFIENVHSAVLSETFFIPAFISTKEAAQNKLNSLGSAQEDIASLIAEFDEHLINTRMILGDIHEIAIPTGIDNFYNNFSRDWGLNDGDSDIPHHREIVHLMTRLFVLISRINLHLDAANLRLASMDQNLTSQPRRLEQSISTIKQQLQQIHDNLENSTIDICSQHSSIRALVNTLGESIFDQLNPLTASIQAAANCRLALTIRTLENHQLQLPANTEELLERVLADPG